MATADRGDNESVVLVTDRAALRAAVERALRGGPTVRTVPVADWTRGHVGAAQDRLFVVDIATSRSIHEMLAVAEHWPSGFPGSLMVVLGPGVAPMFQPNAVVDDILVEPFGDAEVAMRVRHLLWQSRMTTPEEVLVIGDLTLDTSNYEVSIEGKPLDLTFKEYELLRFLATHPGRVFTRDVLLSRVWGDDYYGGARTVDVHIRRLRVKLAPRYENLISTVRNVGYRFQPE
jgi:hypothetical protein